MISQVCSVNFNGISFISFIFEITQNYTVIFLKVMSWKQTSKISQFFTWKHKINESNAKIIAHYWIVCLYSEYVSFDVFIPDNVFKLFRNMFNTKAIEINNFISVTKQNNPMCAYVCISSIFITYAPSFILLDRLFLQ